MFAGIKTKRLLAVLTMIITGFLSMVYGQEKAKSPLKYSAGIINGYNRGYGIQANFTVYDFKEEFPFKLRFGIGYTFLNPGDAADARRIFINNATNGVPEKKGRSFDYRLDLLMPRTIFGVNNSYLVFGPRYSTFNGNFKYVGGNEDFDVRSKQWGVGGDIENHFKMMQNLEFVIVLGLDFYFPAKLSGHDTSYSPDNDNVNPNDDNQNDNILFRYKDANRAIKQPMFMPRAMFGVNFKL
jgi:hypothetical protein